LSKTATRAGHRASAPSANGSTARNGSGPLVKTDSIEFTYAPFPMAVVRPVFDEDVYEELSSSFPSVDKFKYRPELGRKYSLSEVNNPEEYHDFLRSHELWRRLFEEIKSDAFVERWLRLLADNGIDLGILDGPEVDRTQHLRNSFGRLRRGQITLDEFRRRMRNRPRRPELSTRFEFSMLPADGGHIPPHTDAPQKVITLVFSMCRPGEWDPAWGGGTNMDRPRDERLTYNQMNRSLEFEDVEPFKTFEFEPNQVALFIKTFNSLHSVPPMTGPEGRMRRTLTLNIELAGYV
jgi:hypothetical protein